MDVVPYLKKTDAECDIILNVKSILEQWRGSRACSILSVSLTYLGSILRTVNVYVSI